VMLEVCDTGIRMPADVADFTPRDDHDGLLHSRDGETTALYA